MKQISKYVTLSDTNDTLENEVDRKVHREIRVNNGAKIYLQKTIIHRLIENSQVTAAIKQEDAIHIY